jgi:ATP-dependent DNA helicase HFM1/MER3
MPKGASDQQEDHRYKRICSSLILVSICSIYVLCLEAHLTKSTISGRNFQTHESSHQLIAAPSPNSNRLSLVSRSIYHQQERQPRAITNADHHFRFAQNLRQGLPVNRVAPAINQIGIQSPLSKLATDMLLQRPVPYVTAEPVALLQGLQPTNQMQSRRQHITPPFNLGQISRLPEYTNAVSSCQRLISPGGFIYSPTALQNSRSSSSPAVQHSSPTVRVNVRRLSNRPGHSSGHVEDGHVLDKDTAPPETPRQHEAPVETPFTERAPQALALNHAPPMAHGIQLVSPHELPDRFRQIFPYELFNAAQSKCFGPIYRRNDNVVVSAPTGSGKTAILELAICRLIEGHRSGEFKIVYQAPTKSLCSERMRDWQKKFSHLNLPCAELTGDTNHIEMNRVRGATIIITTIEKWDSITRQWHDHTKLLQLVKLFLIDEVHMLKDSRGATLEAVVSRMKSIGANVRFVALSATVPNAEDIALWLGKDPTNEHLPAHREIFGEDFRPVKLQKHVYGFEGQMNDFAFEKVLDGKLPNLIMKHTAKKPIMVFCFTRKSCESTAIMLAEWWTRQKVVDRAWPAPIQRLVVGSKELQDLVELGVAFHHAGLDPQDRNLVETAYLKGDISVICCTSTLAVGVNLPCHLIVLKGTVGFQDGGLCEYSDLEVMQMLGRAGRPQFDDSAVAVIMTRSDKVQRYKNMITGREVLESTLHLSLMEHLNSEIGLGTVYDLESARRWLSGTFLSVRMRQNPSYYKLEGISPSEDANKWLRMVCERDIRLLQDHQLVSEEDRFSCTSYGLAMSRYMVQFDTMKLLLSLPRHAKADQIVRPFFCMIQDAFTDKRSFSLYLKPLSSKIFV